MIFCCVWAMVLPVMGRKPLVAVYLELQRRLPRRPPPFGPGALADDAVELLPDVKLELHLHLRLRGVDEVVIAGGAGFAPQRPGHRVDDGGLAVAVIAGKAGEVDAGKVQRRDVIPVAHEVAHFQPDGNHLDPIVA